MSEQNKQTLLDIMSNVTTSVQNLYVPVLSGEKLVNTSNITSDLVNTWEELEEQVFDLVDETERIWHLDEDDLDTQEDED